MRELHNTPNVTMFAMDGDEYVKIGEIKEMPVFEPGEPLNDSPLSFTINTNSPIEIKLHLSWWQRYKAKRAFRKIFGRKTLRILRRNAKKKRKEQSHLSQTVTVPQGEQLSYYYVGWDIYPIKEGTSFEAVKEGETVTLEALTLDSMLDLIDMRSNK